MAFDKVVDSTILDKKLPDLANKIRSKTDDILDFNFMNGEFEVSIDTLPKKSVLDKVNVLQLRCNTLYISISYAYVDTTSNTIKTQPPSDHVLLDNVLVNSPISIVIQGSAVRINNFEENYFDLFYSDGYHPIAMKPNNTYVTQSFIIVPKFKSEQARVIDFSVLS